jgi:hypothetical protein
MSISEEIPTTDAASLWAVLLTTRQRWLLEACVAWHARVHDDPELRQRFAELQQRLHDARLIAAAT